MRPQCNMFWQARLDVLESRQLLTATLQQIAPVTVPALQGTTIPLLADTGDTDAQTYTVTSSNPDIAASVASGPFWSLGVTYTDPTNSTNSFSGTLTYQLFQTLAPNTVSEITNLTNSGYFVNTGRYFDRIFPGFVVQGGSPTLNGGEPNPPVTFQNEDSQQLAYTGTYQLGMANSGGTDTNSSQFFTTLAPNNSVIGYKYTLFGQLLTGVNTLSQMTAIPVMANTLPNGEVTQPVNPLVISSATLSSTNPNGTLIIDTTQATPGETSTITVTPHDARGGPNTSQSFVVTVGAYSGPTDPTINFKPIANPVATSVAENSSLPVQLFGENAYPDTSAQGPLTYALVSEPSHGTVTGFNATTGTFIYTPATGFAGIDTFKFAVTTTGPNSTSAPATSNAGAVTIDVIAPLVDIENVQLVMNRKHQVAQIRVTFSGPVDLQEASHLHTYRLAHPAKNGSYTARNAVVIKLRSAAYSAINQAVALTPRKLFSLTKQPIQLLIDGTSPSGLQNASGQYLDGANNDQAGSNAIILISRNGVEIE